MKKIAVFQVKEYPNRDKTNQAIAFQDFANNGANKVDLGHNNTGYQDAGAGHSWMNWNEGRWALSTQATTKDPDKGIKLAKESVAFLEKNTLPIPDQHGSVHLDATCSGSSTSWQKGNIVYTLKEIAKPIDALKIAVTFE